VEFSAPEAIAAIPDCNQDLFIGNRACTTFLFSPNDSSVVQVSAADCVSAIHRNWLGYCYLKSTAMEHVCSAPMTAASCR
jgi:hypothetical protein